MLLGIDSPDLEKWLANQTAELDLLWKFYVLQGMHVQAGDIARKRATDSNESFHLDDRIECLVRALGLYTAALNIAHQRDIRSSWRTVL